MQSHLKAFQDQGCYYYYLFYNHKHINQKQTQCHYGVMALTFDRRPHPTGQDLLYCSEQNPPRLFLMLGLLFIWLLLVYWSSFTVSTKHAE